MIVAAFCAFVAIVAAVIVALALRWIVECIEMVIGWDR